MVRALFVVMGIMSFIMFNIIDKIEKNNKKINKLENMLDGIKKYNYYRLMRLEEEIDELEIRICELEGCAKPTTKSCSIDGKCNYMDKFTTVK